MKHPGRSFICFLAVMAMVVGCGNKEEKKLKFFNKGMALYGQGDYVKAPLEFKNAIQIEPNYAQAYHMLGMVALKTADYKKAFGYFGKAISLDSELLDSHVQQGRLLLAAKQPEKAAEKADLVLGKNPDHADALLLRAGVLFERQQYEASAAILNQLISGGNQSDEIYGQLAAIAIKQSKPADALSLLGKGISLNSDSEQLYLMTAGIYAQQDQIDAAAKALDKVIGIAPDNLRYRLSLADLWWKNRNRVKTDQALEKIIALDPENSENYLSVARFWDVHKNLPAVESIIDKGLHSVPDNIKLRLARGELLLKQNRIDDSIKMFEDTISKISKPDDPDCISAQNALAHIYLKIGEVDKALTISEQVLGIKPKNNTAHIVRGQCLLQLGKGEQAVGDFRIVAGNEPHNPVSYLNLARAHMAAKSDKLAIDSLQKGIEVVPEPTVLLKSMAMIYAIKEDYPSAEAQLQRILDKKPDDYQTMSDLGDLLVRGKAFSRAETIYRKICDQLPRAPIGYLKLARLYTMDHKPGKAIDVLKDGLVHSSKSKMLVAGMVDLLVRNNRWDEAIAVCDQAIDSASNDPLPLFLKGRVLSKRGDLSKAEILLKKAIELKPAWYPPHNSLAALYIKQGRTSEAVNNLKASIEKEPKRPEAYLTLGLMYQKQSQNDEAIAVYETAIEALPNLWPAINNLAFLLTDGNASEKHLEKALALSKRAIALNPEKFEIKDTLAWVYYKMGEMDRAQGVLESLDEDFMKEPIVQYHLGMVYHAQGDLARAKQLLETALDSNNEFEGRSEAEMTLKSLKS